LATPTLVQRIAWGNSQNGESAASIVLPITNATLANNCLILVFQVTTTGTSTIAVTDNIGNTWPASPNYTVTDAGNGIKFCLYILPNATAGVTAITVSFGAGGTGTVTGFMPAFQEWYNIATTSPVDVENSQLASPVKNGTVTSGSITPNNDGELILQFAGITDNGTNGLSGAFDGLSVVTADASGNFTLIQTQIDQGYFSQYYVQPTKAAINPSFSGTWTATTTTWPSITVALKSASSGTAPTGSACRIIGAQWYFLSQSTSPHPYKLQMPILGNAAAINSSIQSSLFNWTETSGSASGAWTQVYPGSANPGGACVVGLNSGNYSADVLSLTGTINTGLTSLGIIIDMVNVGSFDNFSAQNGGAFSAGPTPPNTITPISSNGIGFSTMGLGTGPPNSLVTPAGVFMCPTYTGQTDASAMTSGDCWGIYYFSSNAMQSWSYNDTQASGNWDALAMTFGAGPYISVQPQNQTVYAGQTATFSITATSSSTISYQWQQYTGGTWTNVGTNSSGYTTGALADSDYGDQFRCQVTDSTATIISNVAETLVVGTSSIAWTT